MEANLVSNKFLKEKKIRIYLSVTNRILGLSDVISFRIRTGTQNGVRSHTLRVETHADLAKWVRALVLGSYEACAETAQVSQLVFLVKIYRIFLFY